MNPVAVTGLMVAAMRAEESKRSDRLFEDPFASLLAGDAGRAALASYRAAIGLSIPIIEVRTRFFDEALMRATRAGINQCVILAAGMDARAYRLPWPADTRLFEVDQPEVMAHKADILRHVRPPCVRVAIPENLANDWPAQLVAGGFDPKARSVWLVEGLLQYLEAHEVRALFDRVESLACQGSIVAYDVVGRSLFDSPMLATTLRMMSDLGAPWKFGTDEPASVFSYGTWRINSTDPGEVGTRWNRWPFPHAPPGREMKPAGYLVEAFKSA